MKCLRGRYLFPAIYLALLVPLFLGSSNEIKGAMLVLFLLALVLNGRAIWPIVLLVLTSLATLAPFLVLVQTGLCSSSGHHAWLPLLQCAGRNASNVLLNIAVLSSVVLVAVANEWQGSLVATVNRMALPRSVRIMAIVAGAMIGEFRRAVLKVHHAYTARGQAMPSPHWRNLVVLPAMLGVVWASVLDSAAERLRGQWSVDAFWDRYVPAGLTRERRVAHSDLVVLSTAALVIIVVASRTF